MPDIAVGKHLPTSPDFDDQVQARAFWRVSYQCGRRYRDAEDAAGEPILIRHELESDTAFRRRKRQSVPRSYAGPIIRQYNNFVTRKRPTLPEVADGSLYSRMIEDATGTGIGALAFWAQSLLRAQVDGVAYTMLDTTAPAGQGPMSVAQARERGVRALWRRIDPNHVPWVIEDDGQVLDAIVVMRRSDGATMARQYAGTQARDIAIRKTEVGAALIVEDIGEWMPHGWPRVPLVPLRPQFDSLFGTDGDSQIAAMAEAQAKIFNLLSLEAEELYNNTYTQWVLAGGKTPKPANDREGPSGETKVQFGAQRMITAPAGATLSRIGSDVAQAQSIRTSIADEERALYRQAGISSADPLRGPGQAESGVAKAFRFNDLSANLAALADSTERSHNAAMELTHEGLGQTYPGDAGWPDEFEPSDYHAELQALVDLLSRPAVPSILRKETARRFADRNLHLDTADQMELLEEVSSSPIRFPGPFADGIAAAGT